jgi:hypothetical protein
MNFEQIDQSEKKEDIFADKGVVFTDDFFESVFDNLDQEDQRYIKDNLDLIRQFDEARNQKEATMFYNEALKMNKPEKVEEVYDYVKEMRRQYN